MSHYNFITITPILTAEELNIFSLFNEICNLYMSLKCKSNCIWTHNENGSFSEGFEVINLGGKKENIDILLKEKINTLKQFSHSNYFEDNIKIISEYKDLFLQTYLEHIHHNNYKFYGNASTANHLIKIINLFHGKGIFNQFLGFNICHHEFNSVIVNSNNGECFILYFESDKLQIYESTLSCNGYYQRNGEVGFKFTKELIEIAQKKLSHDNLQQVLRLKKEKSSIVKV